MPVFGGDQLADQDADLAYAARRKTTVRVEGGDRLGQVIDRAAVAFGVTSLVERPVSEQIHCVAFYQAGDDRRFRHSYERWHQVIRLPDKEALSWPVVWRLVTIDELIGCAELGGLHGDPQRIYFWPVIPQGEAVEVLAALYIGWSMWEHALSAHDTWKLAKSLKGHLNAARRGADADHARVNRALGRPDEFFALISEPASTSLHVAEGSGLTVEQVDLLMPAFGYVQNAQCEWVIGRDALSQLQRAHLEHVRLTGEALDEAQAEALLRRVVGEVKWPTGGTNTR